MLKSFVIKGVKRSALVLKIYETRPSKPGDLFDARDRKTVLTSFCKISESNVSFD